MTDLPFQKMFWGDFFQDPRVRELPVEAQGVYAVLLGRMWQNQAWLPADDVKLCRHLHMSVRTWRARYKALITPLLYLGNSPAIGEIFQQKREARDWAEALEAIEKNRKRTERAREEKARKSGKQRSVTAKKNGTVTDTVTEAVTEVTRARKPEPDTEPDTGSGSGFPLTPNGPAPPEDVSVARDLGIAPSTSPAPDRPQQPVTRRRNDWDLPPTPGPHGQTAFLKALNAAAGDLGKLPILEGARFQPTRRDDELDVWQRTNAHFKPQHPLQEPQPPKPAIKEEDHGPDGPSDDDIRDFLKF